MAQKHRNTQRSSHVRFTIWMFTGFKYTRPHTERCAFCLNCFSPFLVKISMQSRSIFARSSRNTATRERSTDGKVNYCRALISLSLSRSFRVLRFGFDFCCFALTISFASILAIASNKPASLMLAQKCAERLWFCLFGSLAFIICVLPYFFLVLGRLSFVECERCVVYVVCVCV